MTTRAPTKRKAVRAFNLSAKLEACLRYLACPECGEGPLSKIGVEWDHIIEWWLSKDSSAGNCQPLCPVCHGIKTNGTKATTAGSSKQIAAKHRRLTGKNKPKRKRPIPSRGLEQNDKWVRMPDGTVELR